MVFEMSDDPRQRGFIEAANTDGSDVSITGDPGDLPDDVDSVLSGLLTDHDVDHYPGGAVIGWFAPNGLADASVRDPIDVESDPHPFDRS
ncbi:hypothetical protein [Halorubrum ruber]|uniref:Uncharacterized protein n=1 Tax=Halorubrum ruber TaxID=2982524 RepID=A0A8T8LKV8_9EURY|nr:hypothetical protein [Halorubrum ruber]QUO47799.1 hypothetical protein J7656_14830 [Halorubrum ruber]